MRTYKHKTLPYTAKGVKGINYYKIEGQNEHLPAILVENSCDWEEVVEEEKDYRILSFGFFEQRYRLLKEWNRFYKIEYGLEAPKYDKDEDNFKAYFYSDVLLQEFKRIFSIVSKSQNGFNVSDFLKQYKEPTNELRFEGFFHQNNLKNLIQTYIKSKNLDFKYKRDKKIWTKNVYIFQPLFKSEDGKEIFSGDKIFVPQRDGQRKPVFTTEDGVGLYSWDVKCYWVDLSDFRIGIQPFTHEGLNHNPRFKYFSNREAAKEFVNSQKVLFTTEDGVPIKQGQRAWVISKEYNFSMCSYIMDVDTCVYLPDRNWYFRTRKAAENYIKMNKSCLSLKEVLDAFDKTVYPVQRAPFKKELTKIVKQKLK